MKLAGAGLALAFAVTGCRVDFQVGDPDPVAVDAEDPTPRTGSVPGEDPGDGRDPGDGGPPPGGGAAVCAPAQLIAELHEQPSDSAEKVLMILTLSNKSERNCLLPRGWAPLGQGGGGGPYYAAVEGERDLHPNPGADITLAPGATAYSGLRWGTGPDCPSAGGWAVAWRGTWLPAEVSWRGGTRNLCPGTFVQGTLQSSPNEVGYG